MSTFSIWYVGVSGEPVPFDHGWTRGQLREALHTLRMYAHNCTWGTAWLLKRERKVIARINSDRFKSAAAREAYCWLMARERARANCEPRTA